MTTAVDAALTANDASRPVLTHLSADTSWLISLPQKQQKQNDPKQRAFFHILLDPWFTGEIAVVSRLLIAFDHTVKAKCQSMADVRQVIHRLETSARTRESNSKDDCEVDLVVVSHYLLDHMHLPSLLQVSPEVPVLTVDLAVTEIQAANHFRAISAMPDIDIAAPETLWTTQPASTPLPPWLRIGRLPSGEKYPELHFATLFAFTLDNNPLNQPESKSVPETIIYTPHGIYADRLPSLHPAQQAGKSTMLAVLHGLNPAWSPMKANLGVHNGYQIAKRTNAKYWIPTHDEKLAYKGIIGMMQWKEEKEFEEGISEEGDGEQMEELGDGGWRVGGLRCREVENGESFVLV